MWRGIGCLLLFAVINTKQGVDGEEDSRDSDDHLDSSEHIGPAVSQVNKHPYAASLLHNGSYVCSATVLNQHWLLTLTKCFDTKTILLYVSHKNLSKYTVRAGSSYNNKGGSIYKINMLINNFDFKMSVIRVSSPLQLGAQVAAVGLPPADLRVTLGDLAAVIAWTPDGHIRTVNVPVVNPSICDTTLLPGHYVCVGGVQDPDRHFCRKDNGGAVVQNNTLIAVASFLRPCASYTKTHAFPRAASFTRWLESTIWDGESRRTTEVQNATTEITATKLNNTESEIYYAEPQHEVNSNMLLSLPFDPVNVPLEPGENNSILPKMSMYEAYLQSMARSRTSPQPDPDNEEEMMNKKKLLEKYGRLLMVPGKYDQYEN